MENKCKYCGRHLKSPAGLKSHERACVNKIKENGSNIDETSIEFFKNQIEEVEFFEEKTELEKLQDEVREDMKKIRGGRISYKTANKMNKLWVMMTGKGAQDIYCSICMGRIYNFLNKKLNSKK